MDEETNAYYETNTETILDGNGVPVRLDVEVIEVKVSMDNEAFEGGTRETTIVTRRKIHDVVLDLSTGEVQR